MTRKERYAAIRAQGLCFECGVPSPKFSRCLDCRLLRRHLQREYERRYYVKNKPKRQAAERIRYRRQHPPRIAEAWF